MHFQCLFCRSVILNSEYLHFCIICICRDAGCIVIKGCVLPVILLSCKPLTFNLILYLFSEDCQPPMAIRVVFPLTFAVNVPSQGLNCQRFRVLWSLICHGPFYVIYTIILSFIKLTSRTRHISNFFLSRVFVGSVFFNTFSRQKHR